MKDFQEKEKTVQIKMSCDVLVAGGGIAGIAAALTAARNGAHVITGRHSNVLSERKRSESGRTRLKDEARLMTKQPIREVPACIVQLKEELFSTTTEVCFSRAILVTQSYRETEGEHQAIRRAKAMRNVFRQMPIFIREGELIVGQRASLLAGRSVYPEYNRTDFDHPSMPPGSR